MYPSDWKVMGETPLNPLFLMIVMFSHGPHKPGRDRFWPFLKMSRNLHDDSWVPLISKAMELPLVFRLLGSVVWLQAIKTHK